METSHQQKETKFDQLDMALCARANRYSLC